MDGFSGEDIAPTQVVQLCGQLGNGNQRHRQSVLLDREEVTRVETPGVKSIDDRSLLGLSKSEVS